MNFNRYQPRICNILLVIICFLIAKCCGIELQHDLEEPPTPRVFKILERNNKVVLQKDDSEGLNRNYFVNFLKKNADLEYRVNNIVYQNPEHLKETLGKKKRLIKRVVPHGLQTRDLVYDRRFKTFFKPLVRLHKTKQANGENSRPSIKIRGVNTKSKREPLKNDGISPLGNTFSNKQLLAPFDWQNIHEQREKNRMARGTVQAIIQLKNAAHLINSVKEPYLKLKLQDIFDNTLAQIAELYEKVEDYGSTDLLRGGAPLMQTPTTIIPDMKNAITLMPGMLVDPATEGIKPDSRPLYPHMPIWNYWTYKNTIHFDECPGDQVKIGPLCSRVPPHRKK